MLATILVHSSSMLLHYVGAHWGGLRHPKPHRLERSGIQVHCQESTLAFLAAIFRRWLIWEQWHQTYTIFKKAISEGRFQTTGSAIASNRSPRQETTGSGPTCSTSIVLAMCCLPSSNLLRIYHPQQSAARLLPLPWATCHI